MKKKIILNLLIIITLSILTGCNKSDESTSLMDYGDYKNITEDSIKQIEIIKYTEAGAILHQLMRIQSQVYKKIKGIKMRSDVNKENKYNNNNSNYSCNKFINSIINSNNQEK